MEAFALYLFKSVVWLTGFALVYLLFLRNERYFLLNRLYLVTGVVASIVFPFFTWHYTIVIPFTPSVEISDLQMTGIVIEQRPFPIKEILLILYMAGSMYLLYRIIRQTIKVVGVIRHSEILPYRSAKLIRTDRYPSSFSFFSFVFVNPSSPDTETSEIVNHEMEHVRQKHWIDLLLFELLCTLQWLNPLCWLYGRFIRQNHEFLADQHALQRSAHPAIYRAALINQLFGGEVISLANSFNYSINKKRFHMMTNTIQSPVRKLKLLVILPLIAGVFYAFAAPEYKYVQANATISQQTETIITGKVMDEKGNPLKRAAVVISGKNIGTITDDNGVFKLKITDDSPIVVSHVGYDAQKVAPDAEKEMIIILKPVNIGMEGVTVTGYGENAGQVPQGSSSKPAKNGMDEVVVTALYKGSQDLAPVGSGIKVQTNSPLKFNSADGSGVQPLFVIDGVITDPANVNNIDPNTIESINVLKGESATKLYGDQGKNGVIVITKKKGASAFQNTPIDVNIGQNANAQKAKDVYTMVEQMPEFPGGDMALRKFLAYNIKYPRSATEKGIEGKEFVSFVITKTGSVADAKILRGVDPSLDEEALRIVKSMPAWIPGKQGGKEVDVQYTLPISFVLEGKPVVKGEDDNKPYTVVEQMPEFPGGDAALRKYLAENVKYPYDAMKQNIQGKVFISFVVDHTGKVKDAKVVRGVDPLLDNEAMRVVNAMPLWIPGKQNGEEVDVQYTIPINFVLEGKPEVKGGGENQPYTVVEQMPEYPGGIEALKAFLLANIKYPAGAMEKGIQGKVFVSFVVTETGSIANAKVVRGVDALLDQEALRVILSMPTWIPGKQNGENVRVSFTVPVDFKLPETKTSDLLLRDEGDKPYTVVEQMPEFPGGLDGLKAYMAANVKYPAIALENGIQGKVFISFVVNKDGRITDAKVARSVDPVLDKEALRVVESMPTWIPGKQNGKNVRVSYTVPVDFKLPELKNKNITSMGYAPNSPHFPGGEEALKAYIAATKKYPASVLEKGITGRVIVGFIVNEKGEIKDVKIKSGVDAALDNEAIRIVKSMPNWIPAKKNYENISAATELSIAFPKTAEYPASVGKITVVSPSNKKADVKPNINQAAQGNELIIVPNPTKDKAIITLKGSNSTNKLQVTVIDMNGKHVMSETKNGPSFQVSVTSLKPGTYIVVAIDGSKKYQGSLVINH